MSIVMSIVPHRWDARRIRLPIALIAFHACAGSVPGVRAQTPAPVRVDEVRPGAADLAEPRVFARDVAGEQGAAIPLLVEVHHRAGRPHGSTYILGLPKGARLSDAAHMVTATEERSLVEVTDWNLAELTVTLQPEQTGAFTLAVAALSLTESGRPLPIARSVFTLRVQPRPARAVPEPSPGPSADIRPAVASAEAPNLAPAARHQAAIALPEPQPLRPLQRQAHETGSPAPVREAIAGSPAVAPAGAAERAPTPGGPLSAAPQAASPSAPPQSAALLARAERLIRSGDISGARLVLEHLVERGDARATFLLAQTCDPRMLRAWRVHGLRPDPERASALYARAAEAGLRDPKSVAESAR
ncbi:hypothetical protein NBEOAGPD_0078 [Methylobacterium gregans]|uniref:Uncharacterized protein n=1 Tax=Methylobacterium gregans TaxID=374424 RepID=A0AA37M8W3_9HYPH|nr:hypothetical protein NBEOAGPD_0078 [Methylobacterium gregans]